MSYTWNGCFPWKLRFPRVNFSSRRISDILHRTSISLCLGRFSYRGHTFRYCQPKTAEEDDDGAEETWGCDDTFLQLSLPDSSLVMVDTVEAMMSLVEHFSYGGATIAGMDSEWKPAFGGRQSELALVQVATTDRVFIIDVVNLAGKGPQVWDQLGNCLFRNKEILKLGE